MSKERPLLMKAYPIELIKLAWLHRNKMPDIFNTIRSIFKDRKESNTRSLSKDLDDLNKLFGTKIDITGAENIPKEGGVVLVTSHVVSIVSAPGWINKNVNPFWWASGITSGVKEVRKDEIRPIAASPNIKIYREIIRDVFGGFPVSHGASDKKKNYFSILDAKEAIKSEEVVLIAPEGENRIGLNKPQLGGISRLVGEGIPFIPVAFYEEAVNGDFAYKVVFGKPLTFDIDLTNPAHRKEKVSLFVTNIMTNIAKLLPPDKRGMYSDNNDE
jgi:hypothetical protein